MRKCPQLSVSLAAVLTMFGMAVPVAAQTADEFYRQGVAARQEQRFDVAVSKLERAVALAPENADALVQLGFAQLALDDLEGALLSFEQALSIAPDYEDARFGLAQVAFRNNDREKARQLVEAVLLVQPGNEDATKLLEQILAPPPNKWRLSMGSEISTLSGGRPSWTDSAMSLSYKIQPETTITGGARLATRSGRKDVQLQARVDHVFSPVVSAYGLLAGTPYASILPQFSIGGGGSLRALETTGFWGPLFFSVDLRHDFYPASASTTIMPGVQYYLFEERASVSARWIHSRENSGVSANGYMVRFDVTATDRLRVFAGYSYAPEVSLGTVVDTQTLFAGASFDINDQLTLRGSYAHEMRAAFERDTFGIGLSLGF